MYLEGFWKLAVQTLQYGFASIYADGRSAVKREYCHSLGLIECCYFRMNSNRTKKMGRFIWSLFALFSALFSDKES